MATTPPLSTASASIPPGMKNDMDNYIQDLNLHQAYKMFVVWDYVALVLYFILVVGVGLWSMKGHDRSSLAGYFLAGKNMIWFMVGASLFSSNIGSEHFVGLAGSGAATGIAIGAYELNAMYLCQLLGWVFLPVYIAGFCYTMPEYLKKRFGGKRIQVYIAVLSLALYVLVKISVDIYSASLFIQVVIGWNLYASVAVILALTAIYAVTGGLAAVIYTDTLQTILIVVGALFLMIYSLIEIGGIKGLYYGYMSAVPNTTLLGITECGYPLNDSFKMLREPSDNILPWPGFFLGQTTASIWYWCADQVIVQRALSAKSLSHAQGGTLMAGYLKILPTFMFVIPGMISRVLYTDAVACVLPEACERICGNSVSCSNIAYPLLVTNLLPDGFRGLMLAVMLAALMSSLSSICNSASTVFTIDIWSTFRKQASEKEKMIIGRVLVFILLTVSILWIPVVQATQGGMLFIYIQTITGYLTPPITAVFLGGLLWKRINEQGAFWSLIVGIVIGGIRMVLDFVYPAPSNCEEDTRPPVVALNFMYFALMLFWICVFVMIVISLLTEPPPENRDPMLAGFRIPSISQDIAMGREILRLTFWTRHSQERYEEFPESNVRDKYDMDKGKGDGRQGNENKEDAKEEDKMESSVDGQIDGKGNENLVAENDTSSPTASPSSENQESKLWQCWKWFCGFQSEGTPSPEPHAEMVQRLSSIEQTRKEKVILNINLIFILCFSFFLFMFFTFLWVRPFTA